MTTEILLHDINYNYFDNEEMTLPESEEEHIRQEIIKGYWCGELQYFDSITDEEFSGWWRIVCKD